MPSHFFTNLVCPFAHRAALTLRLRPMLVEPEWRFVPLSKQMMVAEHDGVEAVQFGGMFRESGSLEELQAIREQYVRDVNSAGEVPALQLPTGEVIVESEILAEYIDSISTAEGPRLVPSDPLVCAQMRLAMKRFNGVVPLLFKMLGANAAQEQHEISLELEEKLVAFEQTLVADSPFAVSSGCTLADVHCAPFLYRFQVTLKHFRAHDLLERHPRICALLDAVGSMQEFQETVLSREEFVRAYAPNVEGFGKYST